MSPLFAIRYSNFDGRIRIIIFNCLIDNSVNSPSNPPLSLREAFGMNFRKMNELRGPGKSAVKVDTDEKLMVAEAPNTSIKFPFAVCEKVGRATERLAALFFSGDRSENNYNYCRK